MEPAPMQLVAIFDLAGCDLAAFDAYERAALAVLADHGGVLERRVRDAAATIEVHLLRFADRDAFQRFRLDPHRAARAALFERSGVHRPVA